MIDKASSCHTFGSTSPAFSVGYVQVNAQGHRELVCTTDAADALSHFIDLVIVCNHPGCFAKGKRTSDESKVSGRTTFVFNKGSNTKVDVYKWPGSAQNHFKVHNAAESKIYGASQSLSSAAGIPGSLSAAHNLPAVKAKAQSLLAGIGLLQQAQAASRLIPKANMQTSLADNRDAKRLKVPDTRSPYVGVLAKVASTALKRKATLTVSAMSLNRDFGSEWCIDYF